MAETKAKRKRLTRAEAAEILGCSVRSLDRYVDSGKIPKKAIYRLPGKVRFWEDEIDKIVEGGGIT